MSCRSSRTADIGLGKRVGRLLILNLPYLTNKFTVLYEASQQKCDQIAQTDVKMMCKG